MCGTGKTIQIINYINQNPDKEYLFITPFLQEIERAMALLQSITEPPPTASIKSQLLSRYKSLPFFTHSSVGLGTIEPYNTYSIPSLTKDDNNLSRRPLLFICPPFPMVIKGFFIPYSINKEPTDSLLLFPKTILVGELNSKSTISVAPYSISKRNNQNKENNYQRKTKHPVWRNGI